MWIKYIYAPACRSTHFDIQYACVNLTESCICLPYSSCSVVHTVTYCVDFKCKVSVSVNVVKIATAWDYYGACEGPVYSEEIHRSMKVQVQCRLVFAFCTWHALTIGICTARSMSCDSREKDLVPPIKRLLIKSPSTEGIPSDSNSSSTAMTSITHVPTPSLPIPTTTKQQLKIIRVKRISTSSASSSSATGGMDQTKTSHMNKITWP